MNRLEFMRELRLLLQNISSEERESALKYYNDYFDDAGVENESQVISELGTPKKVAAVIEAGIEGKESDSSEYGESGYRDTRFEERDDIVPVGAAYGDGTRQQGNKTDHRSRNILLIVLAIVALPVVLPLAIAVITTVFSLLLSLITLGFSLFIAAVSVVVSGFVLIAAGITELVVWPALGMGLIGAGLVLITVGMILAALVGHVLLKVTPIFFRAVVDICKRILKRRKGLPYEE